MSIFDRFNRVLKSNLNSLVDSAEDPSKMLDQTVLEMDAEIKKAKGDLVTQLGTAKRLDKKVLEAAEEVGGWENKAVLALRAGDEELAREALKMKHKAKANADNLQRQADGASAAATKLQDSIAEAERRLEDLKARKATLAAQVRSARATPGGGDLASGSLGGIDRLTGRIDQLEAEVEASAVLEDPERAAVDAKFRALERRSGGAVVEDELAALKRKLEG
ncbi:MAG: PspA/IM30 family protein [Deltaproteobacteria bacterium]|jgi:phage shock protein A